MKQKDQITVQLAKKFQQRITVLMLQKSNSMQQSAAEFAIEHSDDRSGKEEKQPLINFRNAMEHVRQLNIFSLQNNDAEGSK